MWLGQSEAYRQQRPQREIRHEHGHVDARGRAGDRRAVDYPEEEDEYVSTCPPISS